ncbi:MAG: hypothetical protein SPD81_01505, partial [Candidatus Faecousia sp.]|nr:hypothetical protein [Candidatus Faecousia sp.]
VTKEKTDCHVASLLAMTVVDGTLALKLMTLPPGGRGTAKRWMRNGDISSFGMQLNQTVQTFPIYLFNEVHTNMEHIAVPHPPQCAHWGTFPPGEGIAVPHLNKFQFIGLLGKNDIHFFEIHPRRGYHILYLISDISYLPCGGIF